MLGDKHRIELYQEGSIDSQGHAYNSVKLCIFQNDFVLESIILNSSLCGEKKSNHEIAIAWKEAFEKVGIPVEIKNSLVSASGEEQVISTSSLASKRKKDADYVRSRKRTMAITISIVFIVIIGALLVSTIGGWFFGEEDYKMGLIPFIAAVSISGVAFVGAPIFIIYKTKKFNAQNDEILLEDVFAKRVLREKELKEKI